MLRVYECIRWVRRLRNTELFLIMYLCMFYCLDDTLHVAVYLYFVFNRVFVWCLTKENPAFTKRLELIHKRNVLRHCYVKTRQLDDKHNI
jgi:hypothetical protein